MLSKIMYIYSKLILKLQYPSIRECEIDKTAKVGYRSNVIKLKLGKHSYLGNNNSVVNAEIGNFCSIASYCAIGGGEHPLNWVSTSPHFYKNSEAIEGGHNKMNYSSGETVKIGNDVWIGEGCFIKSGISIESGAIVGANSVVTKDVPPYAIVAGAPATIIKYRFNKATIKKLLDVEWWYLSDGKISEYSHLFNNPELFIQTYLDSENRECEK